MNRLLTIAIWIVLTAAAPLGGAIFFGLWEDRFLSIPPVALPIVHPPLSWPAFTGLSLFIAASLLPFISRIYDMKTSRMRRRFSHPVPILKAFSWVLLAACWLIAWTRLEPLAAIQLHTFAPLWLSYILLMNVLVYERSGSCPAIRQPVSFALLFPASAVMWWLFEWLNRFVENWRYENVAMFSPVEYIALASAAFATVLPAMLVTKEYIGILGAFERPFKHWICVTFPRPVRAALLAAGIGTLFVIPAVPNLLFPLLWVSPLLILLGLCGESSETAMLRRLRIGDWCIFTHWCLAGVWCGFLWELWNYRSLARWIYEIPYVEALRIFEMPLLGYAGYLPFGLLCGLLCELCTEGLHTKTSADEPAIKASAERDIDILS